MFTCDPILGNVDLRARDFHGEPYYDIPVLTVDQRFRVDAADPAVFTASFHDAEAVLLPPGCA